MRCRQKWDLEEFNKSKNIEIKSLQSYSSRSFLRTCGTKFYTEGGLYVNKWPEGAGGIYYSGYDQQVDFKDFGQGLNSIHPVIFIAFAETIENGQVWSIIERSIKGEKWWERK